MQGLIAVMALAAIAAIFAAGCGSDQQASAGSGAGKSVKIKMGDFFFAPKKVALPRPEKPAEPLAVTIEAVNTGSVTHELALFMTTLDPGKLPAEANGRVDEERLEQTAGNVGKIEDVEAGETKSKEFDLTPGTYVMFSNLPGQYSRGMYGTLTVSRTIIGPTTPGSRTVPSE